MAPTIVVATAPATTPATAATSLENYFATFHAFNAHLLAKLGPEAGDPDSSGSGSSDAADETMVVETPKKASRKETLARLKDYENHLEDAESALAIFEGFVAPTVLEHIEDCKCVYEANEVLRRYYAGRNPAASTTIHALDALSSIRAPDTARRRSMEDYAQVYHTLAQDFEAYLKDLKPDELLFKLMANMLLRTAPETGNFISIRLRLMQSADEGGYKEWRALLTDIDSAVQLDAQYGAIAKKEKKCEDLARAGARANVKESARSAMNKRPPKVRRITRELFGLPDDFDRTKARPGDYGTCAAHSTWEPHGSGGCPDRKPLSSGTARAKASRPAQDDSDGPRAKSARTGPKVTKLREASAISQFLRGEPDASGTAPDSMHASSARDSSARALRAGETCEWVRAQGELAGDKPPPPRTEEWESFTLPAPAREAWSPRGVATPSVFLSSQADGTEAAIPLLFTRKTPAKEKKRLTLKEYTARH
ncbi:hypothetical protein HK405_000944, partial [Cladochytrium tenue]